jgi:DNA-binding transcriptional LysR family regulator
MLDELRALIALEATGTISEAAVRLRLTQSAASKRVQALEAELGYKVTEPDGRKLKLTAKGIALLARAKPLLIEFEGLRDLGDTGGARSLAIGISDSIASSWGPRLIKKSLERVKKLELEIHVHRSTLVLEQLRSGRYELGIVTGRQQGIDLSWNLLTTEAMVLVGRSNPPKGRSKILSIEMSSATWREIGKEVMGHEKIKDKDLVFLESFSAAAQMAKEEFAQALIPIGLARTLGFKRSEIINFSPGIKRHVYMVTRKSVGEIQCVRDLYSAMTEIASVGSYVQ